MDYRQMAGRLGEPRYKTTDLAASDTGKADIATVGKTNRTLYVQRVTYVPITVHATAITVQDDANTPVKIGLIPASQATPFVMDFGVEGTPLTEGKNLDASAGGAGPAGRFVVEAYQKLTAVIAYTAANQ